MPGISTEIIQHKLDVDPKKKPIQQRRQVFAPKWNQANMNEVNKLLAVGFIREVLLLELASQRRPYKEGKWEMEDVRGLYKPEQGLPKGQLPPTEDKPADVFHSRTQAPNFYGRILRVQPDKNGKGRPGENCLHHKPRALLL